MTSKSHILIFCLVSYIAALFRVITPETVPFFPCNFSLGLFSAVNNNLFFCVKPWVESLNCSLKCSIYIHKMLLFSKYHVRHLNVSQRKISYWYHKFYAKHSRLLQINVQFDNRIVVRVTFLSIFNLLIIHWFVKGFPIIYREWDAAEQIGQGSKLVEYFCEISQQTKASSKLSLCTLDHCVKYVQKFYWTL